MTEVRAETDRSSERQEIEARLAQAYVGETDRLLEEIEAVMDLQAWPEALELGRPISAY